MQELIKQVMEMVAMAKYAQGENARLKEEVSYLRGIIEKLSKPIIHTPLEKEHDHSGT
jgi:hypothetical protein